MNETIRRRVTAHGLRAIATHLEKTADGASFLQSLGDRGQRLVEGLKERASNIDIRNPLHAAGIGAGVGAGIGAVGGAIGGDSVLGAASRGAVMGGIGGGGLSYGAQQLLSSPKAPETIQALRDIERTVDAERSGLPLGWTSTAMGASGLGAATGGWNKARRMLRPDTTPIGDMAYSVGGGAQMSDALRAAATDVPDATRKKLFEALATRSQDRGFAASLADLMDSTRPDAAALSEFLQGHGVEADAIPANMRVGDIRSAINRFAPTSMTYGIPSIGQLAQGPAGPHDLDLLNPTSKVVPSAPPYASGGAQSFAGATSPVTGSRMKQLTDWIRKARGGVTLRGDPRYMIGGALLGGLAMDSGVPQQAFRSLMGGSTAVPTSGGITPEQQQQAVSALRQLLSGGG